MATQGLKAEIDEGDEWKRRLAPLTTFLDIGGRLVALASVLAALLYYFGFARSKALYLHFGIDLSILNFQTTDYILLSIEGMTGPLVWILVALVVLIWIHYLLLRWVNQNEAKTSRRQAYVIWGVIFLGIGLVLAEVWAAAFYAFQLVQVYGDSSRLWFPVVWSSGIALITYAVWLAESSFEGASNSPSLGSKLSLPDSVIAEWSKYRPPRPGVASSVRRLSLWVLAGLLLYGLFWIVAIAANVAGQARAAYIANYINDQPAVVLYSEKDLHILSGGVTEDVYCPTPTSCWRKYSGLKFLVRSDNKYFLLPANWAKGKEGQDLTIIIPESDSIRIEAAPGQFP